MELGSRMQPDHARMYVRMYAFTYVGFALRGLREPQSRSSPGFQLNPATRFNPWDPRPKCEAEVSGSNVETRRQQPNQNPIAPIRFTRLSFWS